MPQDISETGRFTEPGHLETGNFRDRTFHRARTFRTGNFMDRAFYRARTLKNRSFQGQDILETENLKRGHFGDRTFETRTCF